MSEAVRSPINLVWTTPLRDLLRLRMTGRLDWKREIAAAGLPAEIANVILRVVKQTRLRGMEKAEVANELISHFKDGLAAGATDKDLIEKFGDARAAARLISRAKRRGRPLVERIVDVGLRVLGILIFIYAIQLMRVCLGRPGHSIDYIAKLNEPVIRAPMDERAWPLWRKVILGYYDGTCIHPSEFYQKLMGTSHSPPWSETARWLDQHQSVTDIAHLAAQKSSFGFILGSEGSMHDPDIFSTDPTRYGSDGSFDGLLQPQLGRVGDIAYILSLDARRGAEVNDGARAEADLMAILGLARQIRESNGLLINQQVAMHLFWTVVSRTQLMLVKNPASLNEQQLIAMAHAIGGPKVAADLIDLSGEKYYFDDQMRHCYTDSGTLNSYGLRSSIEMVGNSGRHITLKSFAIAASIPVVAISRTQLIAIHDRLMDQMEAALRLPLRDVRENAADAQLVAWRELPMDRASYALLLNTIPSTLSVQANCERMLGARDGALVGIALELYRREHGKFPDSLSDLTPVLLPQIPVDRITGDPIKYRLIDGKPVVYSVGADRIDDGGSAAIGKTSPAYAAAQWGIEPEKAARGDWVLYPPNASDADDD